MRIPIGFLVTNTNLKLFNRYPERFSKYEISILKLLTFFRFIQFPRLDSGSIFHEKKDSETFKSIYWMVFDISILYIKNMHVFFNVYNSLLWITMWFFVRNTILKPLNWYLKYFYIKIISMSPPLLFLMTLHWRNVTLATFTPFSLSRGLPRFLYFFLKGRVNGMIIFRGG